MSEPRIELTIRREGHADMTVPLPQGSIHIGRAEDNGLVLPDIAVSRRHARLSVAGGGVSIEDVGSGNGTYFQGKPIRKRELQDGDEVLIDPFTLVFSVPQCEADVESTESPAVPDEAHPRVAGVPRLMLVHGHGLKPEYPIREGGLSLGRSEQRDVILPDPAASRSHAEVVRVGEDWLLRDFGSVNGTYVNARRVREHILADGDRIRIGQTELAFQLPLVPGRAEAASAAHPPPAPSPGTRPFENLITGLDGVGGFGIQGQGVLPLPPPGDETLVPYRKAPAAAPPPPPPSLASAPPSVAEPPAASGYVSPPPRVAPPAPAVAPPQPLSSPAPASVPPPPPSFGAAPAAPPPPAPSAVPAAPPSSVYGAPPSTPPPAPSYGAAPAAPSPFAAPVSAAYAPPPRPASSAPAPGGAGVAPPPPSSMGFASFAPPPQGAAAPQPASGGFGHVEMEVGAGSKRGRGRKMKMSGGGGRGGKPQGTFMERNIRGMIAGFMVVAFLLFGIGLVSRSMIDTPSVKRHSGTPQAGVVAAAPAAKDDASQAAVEQLLEQGNRLFAQKKYFEAVEKYADVQRISPSNATANKMGFHACEFLVVQSVYTALAERSVTAAQQQDAYQQAMKQGEDAMAGRGSVRDALDAVEALKASFPDDRPLAEMASKLQSRARTIAVDHDRRKKEAHEASIQDLFAAAQSDRSRGDAKAAIQGFERVLAADPDKKTELYWKAEEQIRQIKSELAARGREAYRRGLAASKSGDYLTARKEFNETMRLDPYNEVAKRRLEETQQKLDQLAQKFWSEAEIYERTNQLDMAIGRYRKVQEYSASNSSPLSQKAAKRIDALMQ